MIDRISDAEQDVMAVLWEKSPLSATEVAERITPARDWTQATVKTLLSRLTVKGAVKTKRDGRRFLYAPAISQDHYLTGVSRRFVDRMFGGRLSPLIAQLAEADELSAQDIAEIEDLLKGLKP
ncbi:MAG: BlaI/MecI/CopY family transcriptional regulator [Parasphingorhabdus sp.]|nr:BlaI/MecI/CopY family transcriptional regulator [Parasphingorhabdus sp.]